MTDVTVLTIDQLPTASHVATSDLIPLLQGGVTKAANFGILSQSSNLLPMGSYVAGTDIISVVQGDNVARQVTVNALGSSIITTLPLVIQSGTGAVARPVQNELRLSVNVLQFGADPTGVAASDAAFVAARNFLETAANGSWGNLVGGEIYAPHGSYLLTAAFRLGGWMTLRGDGTWATTLTWSNAATGHCIELGPDNSSPAFGYTGSYAFASAIRDIRLDIGTLATHGVYSAGAHQFSSLRRVQMTNVNGTGVELNSTGGPTRFVFDEVRISGGAGSPVSSRLGIVLKNGSINELRGVDIEGSVGQPFTKAIVGSTGTTGSHILEYDFHAEYCTDGISCEQNAVGGSLVIVQHATATATVTGALLRIKTGFLGSVHGFGLIGQNGVTTTVQNDITGETFSNATVGHYVYENTSVVGARKYNFGVASTSDWLNVGEAMNCGINATNRIYSLLMGQDTDVNAVAIGERYNGTAYDLVFGTTATIGGTMTERAHCNSDGSFIVGTAALATNATAGFLYIPACAGTPTGTPTARTGRVPIVYDSTNNIIYIYNGAWKKTAALT